MNAKASKALRRIAEKESVGWPDCEYIAAPNQSTRKGAGVTIAVAPRSTRGLYRFLKKANKRG